ncbi:hypothetical protein Hdeb2414_s0015g00443941 [Helianthus debilis subsp. tardiflorus]
MAARVPAEAATLSLFVTTHLICNFYSADFVLKQRIQWCLSLIHSQKMILDCQSCTTGTRRNQLLLALIFRTSGDIK